MHFENGGHPLILFVRYDFNPAALARSNLRSSVLICSISDKLRFLLFKNKSRSALSKDARILLSLFISFGKVIDLLVHVIYAIGRGDPV